MQSKIKVKILPDLIIVGADGVEELSVDGECAADHDRRRGRLVRRGKFRRRFDPLKKCEKFDNYFKILKSNA